MTAMRKCRLDHVVGADDVVAGVDGRIAVITDDMIGTGETLSHAVAACRKGRSAEGLCGAHAWAISRRLGSDGSKSRP
jgi:phosphoribosylpyrophosphate synthetase